MKRFYFLALVLSACVPATRETSTDADSVASLPYEDFSEVAPFTVKEDIRSQPITLKGKRKTALDYLIKFYHPDPYIPYSDDSTNTPGYIITEARVIEGAFFAGASAPCRHRSILMTSRGDFIEREYYDLLVVDEDASGEMTLVDKITFDGSEGQSSTIVDADTEGLCADQQCRVLAVTSSSEGGDINLHKNEWIEYYIADAKSFHPVLRIELEKTDIQDYEATQDENQNSSSELREIRVLESATNGLFDIEVNYTNRQNGILVDQSREVFTFNGEEYVLNTDFSEK